MKRIVCKKCGSNDIVNKDGMYVCNSCGARYSAEEIDLSEEERRVAAAEAAGKRKKTRRIVIPAVCVCIAVVLAITIVIPNSKYNKAMALIDSGDYVAAYELLDGMNYKDSEDKKNSIKPQYEKSIISQAEIGSYVIFGSYEQDSNTSNGKEDIEWLVLAKDENRALMISKYALDCQMYNKKALDVTWETCSLRTWLNDTFMSDAFSSEEQSMILEATVTADMNPSYGTDPGNDTNDKVFLLSITEADKYFSSDSARECRGTLYCYDHKAFRYDNGNCWWWLRSPGYDSTWAAYVDNDGSVRDDGVYIREDFNAVRPALWIDIE